MARDAASRGLAVALLEKEDWASGTSWRSSKLIHGGLRYLKTGGVRLVFESLSERARLMRLAPHLVRAVEFLFPAYRRRGMRLWILDLGLTAYGLLALGRSPARHRRLSREETLRREPALDSAELVGGAVYGDAWTDDARLTLENVLDAVSLGCVAVSRMAVRGLVRETPAGLEGVEAEDVEGGRRIRVRGRVVVNATGPWADQPWLRDDAPARPSLLLAKGIHVTVPAARLPLRRPIAFPASDGRLLFAIPYGPVTILGTTDTVYTGSLDDVAADASDVEYLLREARPIFPGADLAVDDVLATFAGVRPLLSDPGVRVEDTSREDVVLVSESGLLTVTGGKLTTHRRMGARTMDRAARLLEAKGAAVPASRTSERWFPGAPEEEMKELVASLAARRGAGGVSESAARHLAWRYGGRARELLGLLAEDAALARPLCPDLPDIEGEIVFAARHEDARSLADALIRRTHLYWQAPEQGLEASDRASRLLARELGWDESRRLEEIAAYEREVERSRRFRLATR